uniref:Serine/threonine-protein phosphatase 1 regulatory subunit 10 n=1 Tax=Lygus hesperus TaxID=30085 RepID=A0A0K8SQU9_LYGHE
MPPRIDPNQLLRCLSVLLSPSGGIKSKDEVQRIASLMSKFSKKLVSKCIYVLILRTTEPDLLDMFMSAGGWDLTFNWLSDGIQMRNWPLVVEMVELLLLCPVDIERLKGNNCPKLIKMLSKDQNATEQVRALACNVVDQWLAVVKGACTDTVPNAPVPSTSTAELRDHQASLTQTFESSPAVTPKVDPPREVVTPAVEPSSSQVYKITIRDGNDVLAEVTADKKYKDEVMESDTVDSSNSDGPSTDHVHTIDSDSDDDVPSRRKRPAPKDSDDDYEPPPPPPSSKKMEKKVHHKKSIKRPVSSDGKSKDKRRAVGGDTDGTSPEKKARVESKKREEMSRKKKEAEKEDSFKKLKEKAPKERTEQEERDNATLNKLITPSIAKVGKIPKKSKAPGADENKEDESKKGDVKKPPTVSKDPKKYNISIETRKGGGDDPRPKTVKTFNSRFRSTGLEELPPPPKKKAAERSKEDTHHGKESLSSEKKSKKFGGSSPLRKEEPAKPPPLPLPSPSPPHSKESPSHSATSSDKKKDKKEKEEPIISSPTDKEAKSKPEKAEKVEKPTNSPPAKKHVLLETDVFAAALMASNSTREPVKKKKRRTSTSTEVKKESAPPASATKSADDVKPVFKFYQDTLITSEDKKDKMDDDFVADTDEVKSEVKSEMDEAPLTKEELEDEVAKAEEAIDEVLKQENKKNMEREKNRLPKGVLVYVKKKKGLKKNVVWKMDSELEAVRYFELDETERVNVTKNFTDMKQMERCNERMMIRKLASEDRMETQIPWRTPPPIDLPNDLVIPGKNSVEKDIQHARERTTLQAIYFNRNMIPDSPAEPDLEIHASTEPTIIPLEDQTGNAESVISYRDKPWPEPKGYESGHLPLQPRGHEMPSMPPSNMMPMMPQEMMPPMGDAMMGPGPPGFPPQGAPFNPGPFPMGPNPMMGPGPGPGPEWMPNGDGSGVPMMGGDMMMSGGMGPGMPPGPMGPGMMGPGMMGPPDMYPPMGGGPPEFMGGYMGGPPGPGMFPGPQFPGPGPVGPGPGGPPMNPDVRQQRPWFRQNGPQNNNGNGGSGGGTWRHPSKGGKWGKSMPTCKYIISKGFCRTKNCQFKHPSSNKGNR